MPNYIQRPSNMFYMTSLTSNVRYYLPNPDMDGGLQGLIATLVNSARNTEGIVTAQKIGRDQDKSTLKWNFLTKQEWETLVEFWENNFMFNLTYYSPVKHTFITRKFYVSDRTYSYFNIDSSGSPTAYTDCSVALVDTGE